MPFFTIHIRRPDGNAERYNETVETPRQAAQIAIKKYEKFIKQQVGFSTSPREKRTWERNLVPRLVEVTNTQGVVVETFKVEDIG